MINSTKLMITLLAVLTSFQAHGMDVYGEGDDYIKVEHPAEGYVSFQYCKPKGEGEICKFLGPEQTYSIDATTAQRVIEHWQTVGAGVGNIVVAMVAGVGGGYLIGAAAAKTTFAAGGTIGALDAVGSFLGGFYVGAPVSFIATEAAVFIFDKLDPINPFEQRRQAKAVRDAVIYDEKVKIKRESVKPMADRLELVLNKI